MSRSRKNSTPSTLQVLRDTAMARRRSHRARVGATLVATLATLALIAGSTPAYADDEVPPADVTSAETSTGTSTGTTDVAAEETTTDGAVTEEPTEPAAGEPAPPPPVEETVEETEVPLVEELAPGEPAPGADEEEVAEAAATPRTAALATSAKIGVLAAEPPVIDIPCVGGPTPVGGFEIDGNICPQVPTSKDWDNTGVSVFDGFDDSTTVSAAENDDPADWDLGPAPNGKSDIGTFWAHSQLSGGDVYAFFGLTNDSTAGGTGQYDVEYNQLANVVNTHGLSVPNRTPGDLLFRFSSGGSDPITFDDAKIYRLAADFGGDDCFEVGDLNAGWCDLPIPPGTFAQDVNADGTFFEGSINISTLFGDGGCSGTFGVAQARSVTGGAFATSSMKDRVAPLGVTTPSTCATLIIEKYRAGTETLLTGAEFDVFAGTDIDGTPPPLFDNIKDGDAADADPAAGVIKIEGIEPGEYTVVEVVPPTGYFLPADPVQTHTFGESGSFTFEFFDVKQWGPLNVTKTAAGSYDVLYNWSIEKRVGDTVAGPFGESLTKDVPASGDPTVVPFGYEVRLIQGTRDTTDIQVTGNLLVDNPNNENVTANLSDALAGANCTITGGATKSVPPGDDNAYAYTCTYPDGTSPDALDTTNVGTVTWDKSTYPQVIGDATAEGSYTDSTDATTVSYTATETNRNVTVTDLMTGGVHHVFTPAWTETWTPGGGPYVRTYTEPVSSPAGSTRTVVNTAYVKDSATGTEIDNDSATAILRVGADLDVVKVSQESLTREYLWSIDKVACPLDQPLCDILGAPVLTGDPETGEATATYTVTVDQDGHEDSAWVMSGFITVDNPNDWQPVTLTDLTDVYDGGGDCSITASATNGVATDEGFVPDGAVNMTIVASQHNVYRFDCVFDPAVYDAENPPALDGRNTATATWDATAESTPTGTASGFVDIVEGDWVKTPVNETVHLYDQLEDQAPVLIGSVTVGDDNPTRFEYTSTVSAPPGECQDWDNAAWLSSSGTDHTLRVGSQSDAQVRVCTPEDLVVSKTATGTFERTYDWTLDKHVSAEPGSDPSTWTDSDSFAGDVYSHLFGYQVILSQQPWQDSDWKLNGTITLTNGNPEEIAPIGSTVTDTPDVGSAGVCTVDGGPDDGDSLVGYVTPPIASGGHLDIGYECTFETKPNYSGGTNTVTATNTSNSPFVKEGVSFTKTAEHDRTVTVTDDKVTGPTVELTDADGVTYDEGDPDATYTFDYELTHTAQEAACESFPNHAEALGDGDVVLDDADATAEVCPNPGTWDVAKTSDPADGGVAAGSDITYTLSATKTGGVNPEDVVIVDDLSDLAPHVALPTEAELTAAAPAGTTVDLTGNVVTWTIAELSGTAELTFSVTVNADAHDVDLPNLIVSPGSDNCPTEEVALAADECTTDHDTPHYVLSKDSDAGATVMPPYLGEPGTVITYELTVFNDSEVDITTGPGGTMPGATVTDDLSAVRDNATFLDASISPADQAQRVDDVLTWSLPNIPAGERRTLTYQVQVNADQWNETLTNTATPGPGGECETLADCTTTTVTPDFTLMQVSKVDAETGAPLGGAGFTLYQDKAPLADPAAPVVGAEDEEIDTAVSGDDGIAQFTEELQRGPFLVKETQAPEGYGLPLAGDTMVVVIDDTNFASNTYMAAFEFRDPAQGQLAIVAKQQFEMDFATGLWVPSDGLIDYGEQVRYVVQVAATGPKLFHNVTVTDYVPGFNPDDTTSTAQGTLVDGTALCTGSLVCDVSVTDGLVTWAAGTLTDAAGAVEMVVQFPEAPDEPVFDENGEFRTLLWNVAYLEWDEAVLDVIPQLPTARSFGRSAAPTTHLPMTHHKLTSNEVVIEAVLFEPAPPEPPTPPVPPAEPPAPPQGGPTPPQALPNTGGPLAWLPYTGLGMIMLGAWLVVSNRRGRRLS